MYAVTFKTWTLYWQVDKSMQEQAFKAAQRLKYIAVFELQFCSPLTICILIIGLRGAHAARPPPPLFLYFSDNYKTLDFGPRCQENAYLALWFSFFAKKNLYIFLRVFGVHMGRGYPPPPFRNSWTHPCVFRYRSGTESTSGSTAWHICMGK